MDFTETHTKYTQSLIVQEVQDKALKVTEALYRTTTLFSDTEPLKWSLRESAVKILNAVSGFDKNATYEQSRDLEQLEVLLKSLFLKFKLASVGTFIARKNFDLLRQEYLSLRDEIIKHQSMGSNFYLDGFLSEPRQKTLTDNITNGQQVSLSGVTAISNGASKTLPVSIPIQNNAPNNVLPPKRLERVSASKIHKDMSISGLERVGIARLSGRQEELLALIKGRGPSSVGELTKLLGASISEKTVQRELNKMAESGFLKKEGEKRWRRFFI